MGILSPLMDVKLLNIKIWNHLEPCKWINIVTWHYGMSSLNIYERNSGISLTLWIIIRLQMQVIIFTKKLITIYFTMKTMPLKERRKKLIENLK